MEDFDDDFGDLYAGVEAQANSAINGVADFAHFYIEDVSDDNGKAKNASPGSDSKKPDSVCEELGEKVSALEEDEDFNGSDSEDDLKIVLNDEDCEGKVFPNGGRGRVKNDEHEDEGDDGFPPTKEYKYHDNSMCYQHKGSSSQISGIRDPPNRMVAQNRYGFRLPWYRTILDVNIESFEEKPWKYPGVDVTDYFNFGLNEDCWKQYCISLEQLWLTSMQFGIPVSKASKFYQAKEAGSAYEKFSQETIYKETNNAGPTKFAPPPSRDSDSSFRELELPKGRAIQVEDSMVERQPSFDSRHPRSLDSDVVIQIAVQDGTEETSNSGKEQGHTNLTAHEASDNGELTANGNRIIPAEEDDLLVGTPEGNTSRSDRCSPRISATCPMKIDSDQRKNQIVALDGYDQIQGNAVSLETTEIANKTRDGVGKDTLYADQCLMEAQLSFGDDDQLSPTSSCFGSDSEASKNGVHFDPEDMHTPVTSSFENSKSNGIKRTIVDIKNYSTHNSHAQKEHKHQKRRLHSVVGPKIHIKDDDDDDASLTSEMEDLYDRDSSLNYSRQKKILRDFGYSDREDISDYKESRRYADNHVHTAKTNYVDRKGNHKIQDKLDPYFRKNWNEREYFCEDRDRDWHRFGRARFTKERSPLSSRESRGWHSSYSPHTVEERDAQFRRNAKKLQFQKIPIHGGGRFGYKREDDFVGEKFRKCASFTDRRMNNLDEFDERQFPRLRRLQHSRRRGGYVDSPNFDWDDSWSEKIENEYCRHGENQYLFDQSYKESYAGDEGRWIDSLSPRIDVSHTRATDGRYWRHARETYSAEFKESNWFDNRYNADEIDDIIYPSDQFKWRRSNRRSEVLHWTEDQLTVRCRGDKLYSEKSSLSYQKYVRHDKFHAKYGSYNDAMHVDMLSEQDRLELMRKGSSANCINSSSKMYIGKHERTALRCRGSIDLVVGEGKSVRSHKRGSLIRNGMLENMDPEFGGEQTTLADCSHYEKVRAVRFNTQKVGRNQNNTKGLDKFPVIGENGDLDAEAGQTLTEDLKTVHPLQGKHASEYSSAAQNVNRRTFCGEIGSSGDKVAEGYDNQRILATKAKMEKRGERFKEPITLKKEPDKLSKPEIDLLVETAEAQLHRPSRKRRWGGIEAV